MRGFSGGCHMVFCGLSDLMRVVCAVLISGTLALGPASSETKEPPDFSAAKIEALEQTLAAYVDNQKLSNLSYGLWQNGDLVASGFHGPLNRQSDQVVSDTSIHRIYSMTKPVTAIGLLILLEKGHFTLDDPITKFLPEFGETEVLADYDSEGELFTYRPIRPPSMAHLLSHTAGLVYGSNGTGILEQKLTALDPMGSANSDELVQKVASIPYNAFPGSEWRYSIASDLQGAIIERITGESLDTFLKRELFEPLGMTDTGFFVEASNTNRVSDVVNWTETGPIYVDDGAPGRAFQSATVYEGGGGLFSTQRDFQKFAHFLLNEGQLGDVRLLGEERIQRFRANAIRYRGEPGRMTATGKTAGLGFGFGVATLEDRSIAEMNAPQGTYFWHGALGSWFWVDPTNQVVFVGMTQTNMITGFEFIEVSMRALYDPPQPDPAETTAD